MKPLFIFRPEPGWTVTAETARASGFDVRGAPLFEIEPVDWKRPDPADYDGLLIGSANVFRHGGEQLAKLSKLPVHAVGQVTADAAGSAGFMVGRTGKGGLQALLDGFAGRNVRLLRLAGDPRLPLKVPDSVKVDTIVVYRSVPESLREEDGAALARGATVLLHSGAAAVRFREECDRLNLNRDKLDLIVIGPRVAEMAGENWGSLHVAKTPDDRALLVLAESLCKTA